MLPRTVLLLFLCVSVGMCATLGHYQARAEAEAEAAAEAEEAALREAAAADLDPATVEGVQADVQVDDSPADNSLPDDNILAETPAMEDPKPEADVPEADNAAAKEKETKSDDPVVGSPAAQGHTGEEVTKELPLEEEALTHEKPAIDEAVTQANLPEEPAAQEELPVEAAEQEKLPVEAAEQEKLSEEALEQDKLSEEAVKQEEPLVKEEEDNEIKPIPTKQALSTPSGYEESSSWGLNSIRNSFQTMHGYFDSLVELVGGRDGVCQYRCRYGETPQPRPGYQLPEPNGCSSFLVGYQLDLGIPAMRNCCDELDMCYDTCGVSKYDCDAKFRTCLHSICTDVNKSLGFVSKVEACESMADTLFNTVWTLGCRPYMNSQRAACICAGEERDEL